MVGSRSSGSPNTRSGACPVLAAVRAALRDIPEGCRLSVGYSGGLDSTVLLHALTQVGGEPSRSLSAIHVHHGINPQADAWAAHCRSVCAGLGVPLRVERVSLTTAATAESGLEGAAREARYAAFAKLDVDLLLLAHHRDDQAETLLLNLGRGCGLAGAAAMPDERPLGPGNAAIGLRRPLLGVARADLERYAADAGLGWIDDDSNADLDLARNRLRHQVLPAFEEARPGAGANLAAASRRFSEALSLLDELADLDLAAASSAPDARIEQAPLLALSPLRRINALRRWLTCAAIGIPGEARLIELAEQIAEVGTNSRLRVDFGAEHSVRLWRGRLYLVRERPAVTTEARLPLKDGSAVDWGSGRVRLQATVGAGIAAVKIGDELVLRPRSGGERLRPAVDRPSRSLQELFAMAGIPPWSRTQLPLLWDGGRLLWVAEVGFAGGCAAAAGEPGWLPLWEPARD
ncbi:MAG TPA: tRNA lysidine(34) synthetase TilS [Rhodocyclaceae bacterium]